MRILKTLIPAAILFLTYVTEAQVTANFSSDKTEGCSPVTIQFSDLSTATNLRYRWSFGNGNLSTKQNPQAIFYKPGTYEVSLEVTDPTGVKDEKKISAYITVFKNPTADLKGNILFGCAPLSVQFEDKSKLGDAPLTSILWDFGDGNTVDLADPLHTYRTDGNFDVSLLITDGNGCQDKNTAKKLIEVDRIPDIAFKADVTFGCDAPLTVTFDNASTKIKSGDMFLWNFGDGNTSTQKSPVHTYTNKGKFDVTLTITTPNGCSISTTLAKYIVIGDIAIDFEVDKRNICAPTEVFFRNKTQPAGLTAKWDFGDGTIVSGYNVKHTYTTSGAYDVTLSVEKDANCKSSVTLPNYISVINYPKASFTHDDTFSCKVPYSFIAFGNSTGAQKGFWYLDGALLDSVTDIFKRFERFGTYKLDYVAENQFGCKDTATTLVVIKDIDVEVTADTIEGCIPLTVDFQDISTYDKTILSKKWIMGDGTEIDLLDDFISYTYQDTGVFTMTLQVETTDGCIGTTEINIRAGMKTSPNFESNLDTICNGTQIELTNLTNLDAPNLETIFWHIYDSSSYNNQDTVVARESFIGLLGEPLEHYREAIKRPFGWYNAELVTVHNGCRDTVTKDSIFYVARPLITYDHLPFNPCTTDSIIFRNTSIGADSTWWNIISQRKGVEQYINDSIITIYRSEHGNTQVQLVGTNFDSQCVDGYADEFVFITGFDLAVDQTGDLCSPANLRFTSAIRDSILTMYTYNWTVAGSTFTDEQSVFRSITQPGNYAYSLEVIQVLTGCSEFAQDSFVVTGPTVSGAVTSTGSCPPVAIRLTCDNNPSNYDSLYWFYEGRRIPITGAGVTTDTLFTAGRDSSNNALIQLIGVDSNGCIGIQEFKVQVEGPKSGDIKLRRFKSCVSQRFLAEAIVPGYNPADFSYEWDLGNGDTSTKMIASAVYSSSGQYDVELSITDNNGCKSRYYKTIDINKERLNADFDADSIDTDCPPVFVQFNNRSTATSREIKSYYWEFGDGSTSIETDPSKLYLSAGKYTVKLYVVDDWGCEDSLIYPDFVIVNGPIGKYEFDENRGCVPLTVNFTSTTKRANFYEWDLGDGTVVKNTVSYTHVYNEPGRFIPLLILKDTFGCDYTLPPIDTIYVDPYPDPDFIYEGTCINYPITFKAANKNELIASEYIWEMYTPEGIDTLYGDSIQYTFYEFKQPEVRLTIISRNGCSNSILKPLELKTLESNFASSKPDNCVGTIIQLRNLTESDTSIIYTKWIIDGVEYTDLEPSFFADNIGSVDITLIQENILGCRDTIQNQALIIGDSVPPLDLEILRVSVVDDNSIILDYKRSATLDFDAYIIYQEDNNTFYKIDEVADRETVTRTINNKNTLSTSYCFKIEARNTCGLLSDTFTALKHCTIETDAQGDTNLNVVNWSPYIGWSSIATYDILRKVVGSPSASQLIGTVPSDSLHYIDSTVYCNIEYSYRIQANEAAGNSQLSLSDTAHAMPVWFYTPPPNKLVRATVEDDLEIRVEWDSVKGSQIPITTYVLQKSFNGSEYVDLYTADASTFDYVDDDVLVDDYSYYYRTYAIDECYDTSDFWNYGKTILLDADTSLDQRPELNWSHYLGWTEDISYYTVEIKNPDNTFLEIASFTYKDTTFIDLLTDLNQRPDYCYRIVAYKEQVPFENQVVSVSNVDCSPVRSKIFYPNAFTPNGDNLNEFYVTPSEYIKEYHIRIFNRWGEKVFESFDVTKNWDGTYNGKDAQQDAYAVLVNTIGVDGIQRVHHGTITVLR